MARVPWARHDSRFTREFEEQCSWMAVHLSKTTLSQLMRIAWRSVGRIISRVVDERSTIEDRLDGLSKIGIDEVSFRKGQRYLTVVVDHATARVVWAAEGRDEATLERFFDLLGATRSTALQFVTADGASWIGNVLARRCPQATVCLDPFHVVSWATDALDQVRREVWNVARRAGHTQLARDLKGMRFALWKNPLDLTRRQDAKLANIARTNKPLYRAYLLKEQLREVFQLPYAAAVAAARALDPVGATVSPAAVRQARAIDHRTPPGDPRRDQARSQQRACRVGQHSDPAADQDRLRLPLGTAPDRHGHARPGRSVPGTARPLMTTHGKSRRPVFGRGSTGC